MSSTTCKYIQFSGNRLPFVPDECGLSQFVDEEDDDDVWQYRDRYECQDDDTAQYMAYSADYSYCYSYTQFYEGTTYNDGEDGATVQCEERSGQSSCGTCTYRVYESLEDKNEDTNFYTRFLLINECVRVNGDDGSCPYIRLGCDDSLRYLWTTCHTEAPCLSGTMTNDGYSILIDSWSDDYDFSVIRCDDPTNFGGEITTTEASQESGLPGYGIALIVVFSLLFVGAIAGFIGYKWWSAKKERESSDNEERVATEMAEGQTNPHPTANMATNQVSNQPTVVYRVSPSPSPVPRVVYAQPNPVPSGPKVVYVQKPSPVLVPPAMNPAYAQNPSAPPPGMPMVEGSPHPGY